MGPGFWLYLFRSYNLRQGNCSLTSVFSLCKPRLLDKWRIQWEALACQLPSIVLIKSSTKSAVTVVSVSSVALKPFILLNGWLWNGTLGTLRFQEGPSSSFSGVRKFQYSWFVPALFCPSLHCRRHYTRVGNDIFVRLDNCTCKPLPDHFLVVLTSVILPCLSGSCCLHPRWLSPREV